MLSNSHQSRRIIFESFFSRCIARLWLFFIKICLDLQLVIQNKLWLCQCSNSSTWYFKLAKFRPHLLMKALKCINYLIKWKLHECPDTTLEIYWPSCNMLRLSFESVPSHNLLILLCNVCKNFPHWVVLENYF